MKSKSLVIALALATSLAALGTPRNAAAEERGFYMMMGAGVAQAVGDAGDVLDTGGGIAAGVGFDFTENVALEGEFIAAWASLDSSLPSGYSANYSGMFGPRFSVALTKDEKFGIYAGGGIGVVHSYLDFDDFGSTDDTRFGWQVKAGAEYALSDAFDLLLTVGYVATAQDAGDGIFGAGIGFRFYPAL